MDDFIRVKDSPHLSRDQHSQAIVNTDTTNSGEIHFNTDGKVTTSVLTALATYDITDSDTTQSITKRVPTNEPYREHENKPANTEPSLTDREQADQRFLG